MLVPYLNARGGVRLADAAEALDVSPEQLLKDLKVLFMCGLPGGYPDDLIDVDLDALEGEEGEIRARRRDPGQQRRLPRPSAAADADRGLRGDRRAARPAHRRRRGHGRHRRPGARQAGDRGGLGPGDGAARRRARTTRAPPRPRPSWSRACATRSAARCRSQLDYYVPARDEQSTARRRPAWADRAQRLHLPRRLVPLRGGTTPLPARPDLAGRACSTRRSSPSRWRRATCRRASSPATTTTRPS